MDVLIRLLVFLLLGALIGTAQARWKPEYGDQPPEVQTWFGQQHNAQGEGCCDKSDGHPFFGEYNINVDGSVTLDLGGGETRTLSPYMVLRGPNPTGHAVWWYVEGLGHHKDLCFAPGTLT